MRNDPIQGGARRVRERLQVFATVFAVLLAAASTLPVVRLGATERQQARADTTSKVLHEAVVETFPSVVVVGFRTLETYPVLFWIDPDTTAGYRREQRQAAIRVAVDLWWLNPVNW